MEKKKEPVWNRTGTGYNGSRFFRSEPGKTRPGSHKNRFLMTPREPEPVWNRPGTGFLPDFVHLYIYICMGKSA